MKSATIEAIQCNK